MGDFCCFTSMKVGAAVTIRMSKEGSSLSDRYNSLKHCELSVETSDFELSGVKKKKLLYWTLFTHEKSI